MDDLERKLRYRLDRASAGFDPRGATRAAVLRRARRKRIFNAALLGSLSSVIIVAALVMGDRFLGAEKHAREVAAVGNEHLEVPAGEEEIASGGTLGVPWALSADPDGKCLTLTLGHPGRVTGQVACRDSFSRLDVVETRYAGQTFVAGSVASDVQEVEIKAAMGQGETIDTSAAPADLYEGPDTLATDRRFFVAGVPRDATFALVVADPSKDGPEAHSITLTLSSDAGCVIGSEAMQGYAAAALVPSKAVRVEADLKRTTRRIRSIRDDIEAAASNPSPSGSRADRMEAKLERDVEELRSKLRGPERSRRARSSSTTTVEATPVESCFVTGEAAIKPPKKARP